MNEISIGERNSDKYSQNKVKSDNQKYLQNKDDIQQKGLFNIDVNSSSILNGSIELYSNSPNKKDNLFVSNLEISKHEFGLDSSNFMENIKKDIENLKNDEKMLSNCSNCPMEIIENLNIEGKDINDFIRKDKNQEISCFQKYRVHIIVSSLLVILATAGVVIGVT